MNRWFAIMLLCLPFCSTASDALLSAEDARLSVDPARSDAVVLRLELAGVLHVVDLVPMRRLETEFAPYVASIGRGTDRLYEGTIRDGKHGWARLSRIGGEWTGVVHDGASLWFLDPASRHPALAAARGVPADGTLAYRSDDFDLPFGFDLGAAAVPMPSHSESSMRGDGPAARGAPRYLKLTLVLDTEFQSVQGTGFAAVAASILNGVDGIYRAQTAIEISLHHLEALSSNGSLTSTNADLLLDAFREFADAQVPFAGLAHLLSGKDFDGTTLGQAFNGSVCSTIGFGINQATLGMAGNVAVVAHEIGHNFNADHDSDGNACPATGFIMAASVNLGQPQTSFSSCSLDDFQDYLINYGPDLECLDTPPLPIIVFSDGFEP